MSGRRPLRDPVAVTVVGASSDPSKWGSWLARGALRGRHRRAVHLVTRTSAQVHGHPTVPALSAVDGDLGLVVISVPPPAVPGVVREALGRGADAFLCITAGIDHALGAGTEQALADEVRAAGARMIGPNCLGLYDAEAELQLAWGHFRPGRLAIVSQSGQLGSEIAELAAAQGLGVSRFVSVGNQVEVTAADALLDLLDHTSTAAVALYVESFADGARLLEAVRRLRQAGKPVLLLTVGASAASRVAAVSHTGSLTTATDVVDAACRAVGALRVRTPAELVAIAHLLTLAPRISGRRVAVVGDSGGQGALAVDVLAGAGLDVPRLPEDAQSVLAGLLPVEASRANPVDLAGAGEADLATYADAVAAVADSGAVDAVVLSGYFGCYSQHDKSFRDAECVVASRIAGLARDGGPVVLVHSMSSGSPALEVLQEAGVPTYRTMDDLARALAGAVRVVEQLGRDVPATPGPELPGLSRVPRRGYLGARELLVGTGIPFPVAEVVRGVDDVRLASGRLTAPYVLKADWIAHKTEQGAVVVGLAGADEAAAAYVEMAARLGEGDYVLEEMDVRGDAVEVILGARRDPHLGALVMVGAGGVQAELWRDTTLELGPVDQPTATAMIERLRSYPVLAGWRGRPGVDVPALARAVVALSEVLVQAPDACHELELNPVRVGPDGLVAVDALVHYEPSLTTSDTTSIRPTEEHR